MISYEPLFAYMEKYNITTYALFKAGFNSATYYSMKSGKSVSTNTINHLCDILDCEVSVMKHVNFKEYKESKTKKGEKKSVRFWFLFILCNFEINYNSIKYVYQLVVINVIIYKVISIYYKYL